MPARLVQTLVARGLLPAERADEAVRRQAAEGGALDTHLLELGLLERGPLDEAGLLQALGEASGYRPVNLADFEPNPDVASFIPPKIAERLCVVPLSLDGNTHRRSAILGGMNEATSGLGSKSARFTGR